MNARNHPETPVAVKKESLKNIIEAVAAKESLLLPLKPSPVVETMPTADTDLPIERERKASSLPEKKRSVSSAAAFAQGVIRGIGFALGLIITLFVFLLMLDRALAVPRIAEYVQGLIVLAQALFSSVQP